MPKRNSRRWRLRSFEFQIRKAANLMRRPDDYMLTAEELRLRRRKRRNVGIAIATCLALVALVFFAGRPARGAIKGWQARRHAAKAFAFLDQRQWTDARDQAIAAYQLRPGDPQE